MRNIRGSTDVLRTDFKGYSDEIFKENRYFIFIVGILIIVLEFSNLVKKHIHLKQNN